MNERINAMQDYINKAFGAIQHLTIQATEGNTNAIAEALNSLRVIFNILDAMKQATVERPAQEESKKEEQENEERANV